MKLVTYTLRGDTREAVGVWTDKGIVPVKALGLAFETMNDLILRATEADMAILREAQGEALPLDSVTLLAPIPRPLQDVVCLGLNYTAPLSDGESLPLLRLFLKSPLREARFRLPEGRRES